MHVFRPRTDLGRCLLAFFPLMCALLVAISRLDDYRHDVWDVTCGAILGLSVAWFSYRRYYPQLRSLRCDVPYDKADLAREGFDRLDDEEQGMTRPLFQRNENVAEEPFQLEEIESPR